MADVDADQTLWYEAHLKPHEPVVRAWLSSRFNSADETEDIIQETLMRILEVRKTREIESPRAFFFAAARNAALMRLRRQQVRKHVSLADSNEIDILIDEKVDVFRRIALDEELEMLTKAIQSLPTRCRQVLTLRKIYGLSQRETAEYMGISENTVETQIGIGTKKIGDYFDRHEIR